MKASDIFVKALENEGVEFIFGVPGEENLDLLESIRNSQIKFILTRHEQGAGFMAATYGRLTGKPGVCLATLGPGATNLVTPAAYAQLGGMPMLMITGQKPIKKSEQGLFQIVDIIELMGPITKFTRQIVNANHIGSLVREAFRIAISERPGSVHLELPEDIAADECNNRIFNVTPTYQPEAAEAAILAAAAMIKSSKQPLLLIGAGGNRKDTSEALNEFVEKTGIFFFTTQMGKGVIDERHPMYLGTAALSADDYLHCAIRNADLIINVGHDAIEKPPFIMKENGTNVIHVNFSPAKTDEVYFPQLDVVGDISDSIRRITHSIEADNNRDFGYYQKIKNEIKIDLDTYANDQRFPVLPQRLVAIVRNQMPDDGIVTLDNGIYKIWFARNYAGYQRNTLLLDNALASMGAGFPSAILAKLINPNKKVMAICGDGGFLMNSQELETAVRLKLNLTVLILNDGAYGMIKWKQQGMEFPDFGLDYNNPDFVAYANAYGAVGHRADSDNSLNSILEFCLNNNGVHVIDVPVDYSLNHQILNLQLKEKTSKL